MSKLADYLKARGMTEDEALEKLKKIAFNEEAEYENSMVMAWNVGDYEKLFSLIVSNQRDKGDARAFITHHAGLKLHSETAQPF